MLSRFSAVAEKYFYLKKNQKNEREKEKVKVYYIVFSSIIFSSFRTNFFPLIYLYQKEIDYLVVVVV